MMDHVVTPELEGQVDWALRELTPEEEQIIRLRFGIGTSTRKRSEIGAELGVPEARIHSIEATALQRLRSVAVAASEETAGCAMRGYEKGWGNRASVPCAPDLSRRGQPSDEGRPPEPPAPLDEPAPGPYDVNAWDEA
jgi:sigma-70-like protein